MTRRLYYDDSYLRGFRAEVVGVEGRRLFLDATAFYPTSGGQPFDMGSINGARVVEVVEEYDGRVVHMVEGDVAPGPVECTIDWGRRFDHMQQHTGQHVLSAVFVERLGMPTLSFHMGAEVSTIELGTAALTTEQIVEVERRANEVIHEGHAVTVSYHDAGDDLGLRKTSERTGTLRVVSIAELDRSACGGTHVRNTAEVGAVLLRKLDKVRGNVRVEFVCGGRAVKRARADYDTLSRAARVFSSPVDDVDALEFVLGEQATSAPVGRMAVNSMTCSPKVPILKLFLP
ncbi:MAG: alanyl-tRNA editing protein [Acidobacteria bacterium]|nr:alanyl-tRNA editing protein [Acidobacteriota bacterium]